MAETAQIVPTVSQIEMPRPAILALIGVALLAATFLVTQGAQDGTAPVATPTPATPGDTVTTPTTADPAKAPAKPKKPKGVTGPGLPAPVASALERREVVVLFFSDPAAADDQATRAAVRALRRDTAGRRVAIFQDSAANLADYRRVVSAVGVSQIPVVVVIDRQRRALVLEGFHDEGSLRQAVEDAL
jgi:hypothetical protein